VRRVRLAHLVHVARHPSLTAVERQFGKYVKEAVDVVRTAAGAEKRATSLSAMTIAYWWHFRKSGHVTQSVEVVEGSKRITLLPGLELHLRRDAAPVVRRFAAEVRAQCAGAG